MKRLMTGGPGRADDVWIWELDRAPATGATVTVHGREGRFGFERAAEDPLRARE